MHIYIYIYICTYIRIIVRPISLLRLIIPARIVGLKLCGKCPMDLGIPPLTIQMLLESNPLKSRILVRRLAVSARNARETHNLFATLTSTRCVFTSICMSPFFFCARPTRVAESFSTQKRTYVVWSYGQASLRLHGTCLCGHDTCPSEPNPWNIWQHYLSTIIVI